MTIIDHVAGIAIEQNDAGNEFVALVPLAEGMGLLYKTIRPWEVTLRPKEGEEVAYWIGFPGIDPAAQRLLPVFFHWFAISACNYARLVGLLSGLATGAFTRTDFEDKKNYRKIKHHCDGYFAGIEPLAPVKVWRDKVAAHFAITAPREGRDNVATLDDSVFYPISYMKERFHAGGMWSHTRTDSKGVEHHSSMPGWSVTAVFEALVPRYWPGALPADQALPTP